MSTWHRAAACQDIPPGEGRMVELAGREIAVVNDGGTFHALDNGCPHRGGPLADGPVMNSQVTCPWHGWQFDCASGRSAVNPEVGVQCYPTRVEGDAVLVEL